MNQLKITNDPDLHRFLDIINTSVKKFKFLLKELATIGKIENEMTAWEAVDINELINDISLSIKDIINSGKANITTNITIANIYFAKKNMRSILYNLISNALKYNNAEQPELLISTKKENGFVLLSVQNNGIGIPEKDYNKVFSMYGRLDKNIEGQGIGLYLIKKIVDAAGGKITVESEPRKGSTFTIFFKDGKDGI